jgi:acrylyl-CoA reductase (NADPH)
VRAKPPLFSDGGGIDLVGTIIDDRSGAFSPRERVVATGHGLGETTWGVYAEQARLPPEWLSRLPAVRSLGPAGGAGVVGE